MGLGWAAAPVIVGGIESRVSLPAEPASAAVARRFVRDALVAWGAVEFEDAALLLTSELVTNALLHARSAPDLTVRLLDGRLRVSVSDDMPALPTRKHYGTDAATGRGLLLIESMASDWGSDAAADGGEGKVVWFEMGPPPDDGARGTAVGGSRSSDDAPTDTDVGGRRPSRRPTGPPSSPSSSLRSSPRRGRSPVGVRP